MPFVFDTPWPGLAAWVLLYISDYTLTIVCARLYRAGVSEKVQFEGSFELTPYFQKDIDSLKRISWRFVLMLILTTLLLALVWWSSRPNDQAIYEFVLGCLVLL